MFAKVVLTPPIKWIPRNWPVFQPLPPPGQSTCRIEWTNITANEFLRGLCMCLEMQKTRVWLKLKILVGICSKWITQRNNRRDVTLINSLKIHATVLEIFVSDSKTCNAFWNCKCREKSIATGCCTLTIFRATSYRYKSALQTDWPNGIQVNASQTCTDLHPVWPGLNTTSGRSVAMYLCCLRSVQSPPSSGSTL